MAGKKPDYHVCVARRSEDNKRSFPRRVGAAWVGEEKGQINLRIDVPLVLDGSSYDLVLFENKDGEET